MSVASKTKTKMIMTVALGFVAALSTLPTWASTTPGISYPSSTVNPVVSTSSNQDLSELRMRLKERFSWVVTEVRSLINGTTSPSDDFHEAAVRTLDVSQWIWLKPAISRQDFFVDIENDPYRTYINRLAAYGVLNPIEKFFPQNYFRVDDFIALVSKLYKKSTNQSLPSQDVLWITSADGVMTKWMLQNIMYSLKNIESITIDGNPYDKLIRSEWAYYLVRLFDVPALETNEQSFVPAWNAFADVVGHPFASDINTLASLGIVSTQTAKFYPDNYLRHYDFVVLFVNSLLVSKDQHLPTVSWISQFADVDYSSSYIPQLTYAADHGLIDYIITSQRGQLYFGPNDFMTKHEVYQILAKALNIQFIYNEQQSDQEKISRAELANLLVESFQFTPEQFSQSDTPSWVSLNTGDMSVLMKLRTLLSML